MRKISSLLILSLSLVLSGCFGKKKKNIKIEGLTGPSISVEQNMITVDASYTQLTIAEDYEGGFAGLDNSVISLKKLEGNGGTALRLNIAVEDIIEKDWETVPPLTLPGNRPLPGVASGVLPAVAVTVPNLKDVTVYVGEDVLGFFIPVGALDGLPTDSIATFKYYINKKFAGNISLVGPDVYDENSGVVVLINYTASLKKLLKRMNKQNKMLN